MARDPSKTEKATPKRIKDARKKGNVAKSQEVAKAISILAGLIALTFWLNYMGSEMMEIFRHFLSQSYTYATSLNEATAKDLGYRLAFSLAKILLPVLCIILLFVFASLRFQVGKLWTTEVFKFKLDKFNPIKGLKRMFMSAQTLIRMGKSLLQALCIGYAPFMVLRDEMQVLPDLYHLEATGVTAYILSIGSKMVIYALIPMMLIAIMDLWYTRWSYAENLKMSKQEVKDERKQQEGDERVRAKMKQKMLQLSAKRMMQQVPKADVVITNPTHIAVALRYDAMEAPAPMVVAMGADRVAEKIKEIARENKVPIRENKPLARALYKQTQVGDMIPAELFQAVAIILAQIWKTKAPSRTLKP